MVLPYGRAMAKASEGCHRLARTAIAVAVVLALVASGCTSDDGESATREEAKTLLSTCPDLVFIACDEQVVEAEIPIVGTGMGLHYRSDRVPGRTVAPRWDAAKAVDLAGWTLTPHHVYDPTLQTVFQGDGATRSVEAVVGEGGELQVASADGSEVYAFSPKGQHLRTDDATTGALIHQFEYDEEGRLAALADCRGGRTEIIRTPSGLPFEIVGSRGHRTRLHTDPNDYLASSIDPIGGLTSVGYGSGGLLTSLSDPGGRKAAFEYDPDGRLGESTDGGGVVTRYSRTTEGERTTVTARTGDLPPVRSTSEELEPGVRRHSLDVPGHGSAEERIEPDGTRSIQLSDGTRVDVALTPDPRWGMQAPVLDTMTATTPGGNELHTSETRTATETRMTVSGATTRRTWDSGTNTFTSTDPSGRIATEQVDNCGNPTAISAPGTAPMTISYDERGRPVEIAEGVNRERVTTAKYLDDTGEVELTDPAGRVTRIALDPLGRIAAAVRPDGRRVTIQRAPSGAPIGVSIDGDQVQTLGWSPLGRLSTSGPTANGLDIDTMQFDELGRPAQLNRPGGGQVEYGWSDHGRLASIGPVEFGVDPQSGQLTSAISPGGVALQREYDGPLPTQQTATGPVPGSVAWSYDDTGRMESIDVAGTPQRFGYDDDGRVIAADSMMITRDPGTGRVASTDAGLVHTTVRYDDFGAVAGQSVRVGDQPLFDATYTRDSLGRVVGVSESIEGERHETAYVYDQAGRLTEATRDGASTTYTYDHHDNRTSAGGVPATYDAADQLTTRGDATYAWAPDGTMRSITTPAGTTTLHHDPLGNLTAASLPDGSEVTYVTDPFGRRTARLVDGNLAQGFLYGDDARPLAETGPDGTIASRFVYSGPGAPVLIETEQGTSRVISDLTGSPRLVVDTITGAVQQRLDFDPFGQTIVDTNPGFQPVSFGGGIADPSLQTVAMSNGSYDGASGTFASPSTNPLGGPSSVPDPVNGNQLITDGSLPDNPYVRAPAPEAPDLGFPGGSTGGPSGGGQGGMSRGTEGGRSAQPPNPYDGGSNGGGSGHGGHGTHGELGPAFFGGVLTVNGALSGLAGHASGAPELGVIPTGVSAAFGAYEFYHVGHKIHEGGARTPFQVALLLGYGTATIAEIGVLLGATTALLPFLAVAAVAAAAFALVYAASAYYTGSSTGDPHLTTHDGRAFEFQAVGEFVLTRADTGTFEVQVRQQPGTSTHPVSINTAVAVNTGGDRVSVYAEAEPPLRVNGAVVDLPAGSIDLPHGGKVVRRPTGEIEILGADAGSATLVRIVHRHQLAISVSVADSQRGHVDGLYGNANGDADDDLTSKDGTAVDSEPTDYTGPLYAVFGNSWRVTQAESLFEYAPGTDTSTFTDLEFPSAAATVDTLDPAQRALARAACESGGVSVQPFLDNCTLDVALLDDTSLITVALDAQQSSRRAEAAPPTTSTAVDVGDAVDGRITAAGSEAHYSFAGRAGIAVYLAAGDDCRDTGLLWIVLGPTGSSIGRSAPMCSDLGTVALDRDGTYTVQVVSRDDATGTFSFSIRPADAETTSEIAVGDHVAGTIATAGDRHRYSFTAEAGDVIYLKADDRCASLGLSWVIQGPEGSAVNVGNDLCRDLARQVLDRDGEYSIVVSGRDRSTGAYAFDVLMGEPTQTKTVRIGDHISGRIGGPGSQDRYEFDGRAGEVIALHAADECAPGHQVFMLRGPEGSAVNVSADVCNDLDRQELDRDGIYVISVTGIGSVTGDYTFDISSSG